MLCTEVAGGLAMHKTLPGIQRILSSASALRHFTAPEKRPAIYTLQYLQEPWVSTHQGYLLYD